MKIKLIILAVTSCVLVGCDIPPTTKGPYDYNVSKIHYGDHDYLHFSRGTYDANSGIVHDPDCKTCNKNNTPE